MDLTQFSNSVALLHVPLRSPMWELEQGNQGGRTTVLAWRCRVEKAARWTDSNWSDGVTNMDVGMTRSGGLRIMAGRSFITLLLFSTSVLNSTLHQQIHLLFCLVTPFEIRDNITTNTVVFEDELTEGSWTPA